MSDLRYFIQLAEELETKTEEWERRSYVYQFVFSFWKNHTNPSENVKYFLRRLGEKSIGMRERDDAELALVEAFRNHQRAYLEAEQQRRRVRV